MRQSLREVANSTNSKPETPGFTNIPLHDLHSSISLFKKLLLNAHHISDLPGNVKTNKEMGHM